MQFEVGTHVAPAQAFVSICPEGEIEVRQEGY